jgi:exosortase A
MNRAISSLLLVPLWAILFSETLLDLIRVWGGSKTYEHGFLILPITVWLIWDARDKLDLTKAQFSLQALLLLCAAVMIWLFGIASNVNFFSHVGAVVALQAIFWFVLGNDNAKQLWFPILFLLFAIPFGEELVPKLQLITADFTVMYLNLVNIPVYREGLYLYIPNGVFHVAEACSGIRFLISGTALSALFAYLFFHHPVKRIIYFAIAVTVPIIANGLRAFGIVLIGSLSDMKYATGADHLIYGWVFFSLVIVMMLAIAYFLSDTPTKKTKTTKRPYFAPSFSTHLSVLFIAGSVLVFAFVWSQVFLSEKQVSTVSNSKINANNDTFHWGIEFANPVSVDANEHQATQYNSYTATYQLAQDQGKLLSSENQLFDGEVWNVQSSQITTIDGHSAKALLLNSQYQDPITVVYWYCVNSFCSAKPLEIVLYSGAVRLFKGDGNASVVAFASRNLDINDPTQLSADVSTLLKLAHNK